MKDDYETFSKKMHIGFGCFMVASLVLSAGLIWGSVYMLISVID